MTSLALFDVQQPTGSRWPAWVITHARQLGLPDSQAVSAQPRRKRTGRVVARWHRCGEVVLAGHAWPHDVTLDPAPTTVQGELFAVLDGRRTVEMEWWTKEIFCRYARSIRLASADETWVLVEHKCGGPFAIVHSLHEIEERAIADEIPF